MSKIAKEVAKDSYDEWCKSWHIGRKKKYLKGEDLEQVEIQEEMIVDMIMEGILVFKDNAMEYTPLEPVGSLPVVKISKPKGDLLSSGDRFKEHQSGKKATAMLAAMAGEAEMTINKLDVPDFQNCMVVVGHFLMA